MKHLLHIILCSILLNLISGGIILPDEIFASDEGIYGYIKDGNGSPLQDVDVSMFDGFIFHTVKTDNKGEYKISKLTATVDYYLILFITKNGYIPEAVNLRIKDKRAIEYSTSLSRTDQENTGYIIGAMYQPVRGGRMRFQSGIKRFGEKRRVWLEKDGERVNKETDMNGHFLFEVPPGKYKLHSEGSKDASEIDVLSGETIIKNIRTGIILID